MVGHELLLLPSVSVLPVNQDGRLLLVRHVGHYDGRGVLGGAAAVAAMLDDERSDLGTLWHQFAHRAYFRPGQP